MLENIHKNTAFTVRNQQPDTGLRSRMRHLFEKPIEQLVSLDRCDELCNSLPDKENLQQFFRGILSALDINVITDEKGKSAIPRTGPLVTVSNHPFGAIEGIILAELLLSIRPDIKVMANFMLNRFPRMKPLLIPVNPFKSNTSAHTNIGAIRSATQWVKQGGALLIFPSGAVSHFHLSRCEISDPPWNPVVSKIVHKTQAPVLPLYFGGSNSSLFQILGMVHPWLRTALLPRELLNKRRRQIEMKIGNVLPYSQLRKFDVEDRLTSYLRWRTYLLGNTAESDSGRKKNRTEKTLHVRPVAPALDPAICRLEIEQLPSSQKLITSGANAVWLAHSYQIPRLMLEIARLREQSFRQAGEGTGQIMDMDEFDAHYLHLFIWNEETREIIGAYRMGCTDKILEQYGPGGLYTSTLFQNHRDFYHKIGPAIELGRSFIRPEYQKTFAPLLLLWRGIGHYIAQHPQYRTLYGPVSISRDYSDFSRRLIASSLLHHHPAEGIIDSVRSKKSSSYLKPMRLRGCESGWETQFCRDIDEINSAIRDIENDHKGIPILLKHYLKLGGRLIAFNEDKNFNEALDGLIVVDLLQTDRKTLARYLGTTGATTFVNYHTFLSDNGSDTHPLLKTA